MQRNITSTAQRKHSTGKRNGISRAEAYRIGLFPWEHDLQHIIVAVGAKRVKAMVLFIENKLAAEQAK